MFFWVTLLADLLNRQPERQLGEEQGGGVCVCLCEAVLVTESLNPLMQQLYAISSIELLKKFSRYLFYT